MALVGQTLADALIIPVDGVTRQSLEFEMNIVQHAEAYVASKKLARNPVHSASRFTRIMGDLRISDITTDQMRAFRAKCEDLQLGAWTIRGTLKDVRMLVRDAGFACEIESVKPPEPEPQPITFDVIESIWPHLEQWSRQWLVLSYWCGLRLADSIRFQKSITADTKAIQWTAKKTGRKHKAPVVTWLREFLKPVTLPYTANMDWCKAIVRAEIERACAAAGVDPFEPQQVRDTSLREWCRADFHVGQVLHGCKLGVIGHYVDMLDILEPVAPRVRVPICFGGSSEAQPESELVANFRKLDPQAKDLVLMTAQRMIR
jgi:hypothetical protein